MKLDLQLFNQLIKTRCGLLFEDNNATNLTHAVTQRLDILTITPDAYYARLLVDEAEFKELVNLLTINETYFFREPEQIQRLVNRIIPSILASHDHNQPIRILSAGCASGEEPYSLVMALLEKYGEQVSHLFSFTAIDIDTKILAKARHAHYTEFSFRGVSHDIRSRYFEWHANVYALKEPIKKLVHFHEFNLLVSPAPAMLCDFDIILFRNVSIYFDRPTRQTILGNLASMMKEKAILIIGAAETLSNDLGILRLMQDDQLFYFTKHQPLPLDPLITPAPLTVRPKPDDLSQRPFDLENVQQWTQEKQYDKALSYLDSILANNPDSIEAGLLKAHILINRKDFSTAMQLLQPLVASDPNMIDALILIGLASKWQQHHAQAIQNFKEVVYLYHDCWQAHYYLGPPQKVQHIDTRQ